MTKRVTIFSNVETFFLNIAAKNFHSLPSFKTTSSMNNRSLGESAHLCPLPENISKAIILRRRSCRWWNSLRLKFVRLRHEDTVSACLKTNGKNKGAFSVPPSSSDYAWVSSSAESLSSWQRFVAAFKSLRSAGATPLFFSTLWVIILRTTNVCLPGLKCLSLPVCTALKNE